MKRGRKKIYSQRELDMHQRFFEKRWTSKNSRYINIRLNIEKDRAIIQKLDNVSNKTDYIRSLIVKDLVNEKK